MARKGEQIRFEIRVGVAQISLHRREALNAFNGTPSRELAAVSAALPGVR